MAVQSPSSLAHVHGNVHWGGYLCCLAWSHRSSHWKRVEGVYSFLSMFIQDMFVSVLWSYLTLDCSCWSDQSSVAWRSSGTSFLDQVPWLLLASVYCKAWLLCNPCPSKSATPTRHPMYPESVSEAPSAEGKNYALSVVWILVEGEEQMIGGSRYAVCGCRASNWNSFSLAGGQDPGGLHWLNSCVLPELLLHQASTLLQVASNNNRNHWPPGTGIQGHQPMEAVHRNSESFFWCLLMGWGRVWTTGYLPVSEALQWLTLQSDHQGTLQCRQATVWWTRQPLHKITEHQTRHIWPKNQTKHKAKNCERTNDKGSDFLELVHIFSLVCNAKYAYA